MNNYRLVATCLLTSLVAVSQVFADGLIRESFQVQSGGLLEIDTDMGSIEVRTHSQNTVEIAVEINGLNDHEFELDISLNNDTVSIIGDRNHRSIGGWFNWRNKVHFEITVPEEFNLDLESSGGRIDVSGVTGTVNVKTSGGSLEFRDIHGSIIGRTSGGGIDMDDIVGDSHLRTSGGSLNFGTIDGNVEAHTSGGKIEVDYISGNAHLSTSGGKIHIARIGSGMDAKTSGGNIVATFSNNLSRDSSLSTSGGSVTAFLPSNLGAYINASGRKVRSEFRINGKHSAKNSLRGRLNDGGNEIRLHASGGTIRIQRR